MKIELTKNEVLDIITHIDFSVEESKVDFKTDPKESLCVYGIMKKFEKYIIPEIHKKIDKLLIKGMIGSIIESMGMTDFGKTKKRKSSN